METARIEWADEWWSQTEATVVGEGGGGWGLESPLYLGRCGDLVRRGKAAPNA